MDPEIKKVGKWWFKEKRLIPGFRSDPVYLEAHGYLSAELVRSPVRNKEVEVGGHKRLPQGSALWGMNGGSTTDVFKERSPELTGGHKAWR